MRAGFVLMIWMAIFTSTSSLAQFPYFQKSFDIEGQVFASGAVLVDSIIYMSTSSYTSKVKLQLSRLNFEHELIDSLILEDNGNIFGYYIGGITSYKKSIYSFGHKYKGNYLTSLLIRANQDLDTQYVKTYEFSNHHLQFSCLNIRNDTIHTATSYLGYFKYYQLDTLGNVLNSYSVGVPGSYGVAIYDSELTGDGAILFSGGYLPSPNADFYKAFFVKVKMDGVREFARYPYSETTGGVALLETINQESILVHGLTVSEELVGPHNKELPYLEKYSLNGNKLWGKSYFQADSLITFGSYVECNVQENGDIVFIGDGKTTRDSTNRSEILMVKVDSMGEILWKRNYSWGFGNYVKSLLKSPYGGYYIFGYSDIDPNTERQSPFLWHVDEFGCLEPGCQQADAIHELQRPAHLTVYPNPTKDFFTIKAVGINSQELYELQILDGKGGLVRTIGVAGIEPVDVRDLSEGRYTVLLLGRNKNWVGNLIVE